MKRSVVALAAALVVGLPFGGGACKLIEGAMGPSAPPPLPPVEFAPTRGARSFEASATITILPARGAYAPDEPHVKIGNAFIRVPPGSRFPQDKLISALAEEGRKRGAKLMLVTGCNGGTECEGALFRTGDDVAPAASVAVTSTGQATSAPAGGPATAPAAANTDGLIANNPALGKALVAVWMPDASGSIPESARPALEAEMIRSMLYVDAAPGTNKVHQGNLIVYTDAASVMASGSASSRPIAMTPTEVFEKVIAMKIGIYLHYEGTDASVFANYDTEEVRDLLASTKKKP